MLNSLEAQQ